MADEPSGLLVSDDAVVLKSNDLLLDALPASGDRGEFISESFVSDSTPASTKQMNISAFCVQR